MMLAVAVCAACLFVYQVQHMLEAYGIHSCIGCHIRRVDGDCNVLHCC